VRETTALGAAYLAGIAEGVWASPGEAAAAWREDAAFEPSADRDDVDRRYAQWRRGVERAQGWARGEG
jgi:glycerol kinase